MGDAVPHCRRGGALAVAVRECEGRRRKTCMVAGQHELARSVISDLSSSLCMRVRRGHQCVAPCSRVPLELIHQKPRGALDYGAWLLAPIFTPSLLIHLLCREPRALDKDLKAIGKGFAESLPRGSRQRSSRQIILCREPLSRLSAKTLPKARSALGKTHGAVEKRQS